MGTLSWLAQQADHSWLAQLNPDPETDKHAPNKQSREVKSGHYVKLLPTPLRDPKYVIHSEAMAESLGLSEAEVKSERFVRFFSGDQKQVPGLECWATPYALSIMGERHTGNCPFGNGNGYGDGRAQSIGEVVVNGQRWEMQLKGGGRTPFCRGADGRAVLRSSVREFLASEAMWALGVPTTRALSLILSHTDSTRRPWYSARATQITVDDPRLAMVPVEQRAQVVAQLRARGAGRDPDVMIEEPCAITTRVAPSFLRVGHLDLFARRLQGLSGAREEERKLREEEHRKMVEHALLREYPDVSPEGALSERAAGLLAEAGERFGALVAGWLRVGFCQGNFNGDNCLVAGRTMDYGPFGWMDQYDPLFAKWVGSGQHFAFMNQPTAALANFKTLALALAPVLKGGEAEARAAVAAAADSIEAAVADTWRRKLGFKERGSRAEAEGVWARMEPLLRASKADWTLFWRQLAHVAALPDHPPPSDHQLLHPLDACSDSPGQHSVWYAPLVGSVRGEWAGVLREWRGLLAAEGSLPSASERMRGENPKYVAREWMLVGAYEAAGQGDLEELRALHALLLHPYAEGTPEQAAKYYRTAPAAALDKGGTAFMS